MKISVRKIGMYFLAIGLVASTSFAAEGNFKKKHPRRAEVLNRANREERKNNDAAEDGKLTKGQARKLDHQDNLIKKEEQADAAANGGHITKAEQRDLNRQENRVNAERGRMEKRDAVKANAGAVPAQSVAPTGN